MISTLSAAFAFLATVLAAVGLYGVLAYSVSQRTREIGLRMALGADGPRVRGMILKQVGWMTLIGGMIGVVGAYYLGRAAASLLFELKPYAPAVIGLSVVLLTIVRERRFPAVESTTEQVLYVTSPAVVTRMALGYKALMADVYWIRAIQHYGGDRLSGTRQRKYELLYPLLDLTTSLDPYFTIAYRFGAIFLSEAAPGGPGQPDEAIKLLQKGLIA